MPLYRLNRTVKPKRRTYSRRSEEVQSASEIIPSMFINFHDGYDGWPAVNDNPVQPPALCVSQIDEPRGMSNKQALGWIAAGFIFTAVSVFGGAKIDSYLREKNAVVGGHTIQAVSGQNVAVQIVVKTNPVETYMRAYGFSERAISALKPLGYKGYWDTNDKALVDRFYFLPNNLRNNERLLSYAEVIARDGTVNSNELSEFIKLECSLR